MYDSRFLRIDGVTSLSADTHKNGLAPKGSSVLVTREINENNLAYYSIYAIPEWSGGIYGTPKDSGSQSCVPALGALLAMLCTGKDGYAKMAKDIHINAVRLADIIKQFKGRLSLVTDPEVNVVAFEIDKDWGLEKGAIYAFAHEMAKRNFVLNTLNNEMVHFCVTMRFVADPTVLNRFKSAVIDSLNALELLNNQVLKGEI